LQPQVGSHLASQQQAGSQQPQLFRLNRFFNQPNSGRRQQGSQHGWQQASWQPQAGSAWQPQVGWQGAAHLASQPQDGSQAQVTSWAQPQPQPLPPPHRPSSNPAWALPALQHRATTATARARLIMGGS